MAQPSSLIGRDGLSAEVTPGAAEERLRLLTELERKVL